MVWKLQRRMNTSLESAVIFIPNQPLSATNVSYPLSQPLRFPGFTSLALLTLAPWWVLLFGNVPLPLPLLTSLAQLLFIPHGALRCHISEPPFLLSWCRLGCVHGRAGAGVFSWRPGGCTRTGAAWGRACETAIWAESLSLSSYIFIDLNQMGPKQHPKQAMGFIAMVFTWRVQRPSWVLLQNAFSRASAPENLHYYVGFRGQCFLKVKWWSMRHSEKCWLFI